MQKREKIIKVYFSKDDWSKIQLFIKTSEIKLNASKMSRLRLSHILSIRDPILPIFNHEFNKDHPVLMLFNDREVFLIEQLSEKNEISKSEVVRALVLSYFMKPEFDINEIDFN